MDFRILDFQKTEAKNGPFIAADKSTFIAVNIDDLPLFGANDDPCINDVMQNRRDRFKMTQLGDVFALS